MNKPPKYLAPFVLLFSLLVSLGAMWAPAASSGPATPSTPQAQGRTIMLGFDGADARTVRELMAAHPGEYPTFEKLSREGTFAPLEGVAPPESPVSWAAINTGQNPAKTGVPGFVKRSFIRGAPSAGFGHIEYMKSLTLEEINELNGTDFDPASSASAGTSSERALVSGVGIFLIVLVLMKLAKQSIVVAAIVGLLAGAGGGFYMAQGPGGASPDLFPETYPVTLNPIKVDNFWDHAARAGVKTVVLDAAQAFGKNSPEGAEVLAGLGVPDSKGALGEWAIFTSEPGEIAKLAKKIKKSKPTPEDIIEGRSTNTSGTVFFRDVKDGVMLTKLFGPANFWAKEQAKKELEAVEAELRSGEARSISEGIELSEKKDALKKKVSGMSDLATGYTSVELSITLQDEGARITLDGESADLKVGEWSDFLSMSFELNEALNVKAITRVRLVSVDPHVELFVDVLGIDPREPPFWQPISSPASFSNDLATDCGLYETYGWPTLTMPVKDSEIDSELLMEDVENTIRWREKLTHKVLERDDWQLFMSVFSTTDRVQHMMYRYYDVEHPLYVAEDAAREMTFFGETIKLSEAIPAVYKQMDRIMGEVLAKLNPEDTLMVCSDHGFQSFRRQVHVNNWLVENGFMTLKENVKTTKSFGYVDWEKTKLYSLGMGFLYVNLEGREPDGIVKESEVDALFAEVREKLLKSTDPENGALIARDLYVVKEVHSGPYIDYEGDAIIGFAPTYRVSWKSTSGSIDLVRENSKYTGALDPMIVDNDSPWSGGHISVALPDVAGVFFCNKQVEIPAAGVRSMQLAPTMLQQAGAEIPAEMDLEPLVIK